MLHNLLGSSCIVVCSLSGLFGIVGSAHAVILVNDTWKDGTRLDPAFGDPDFDNNNRVDGNDFLIWQRNVDRTGTATNETGDANYDTNVAVSDLSVWRVLYGPNYVKPPTEYVEIGDADGDGDIESEWFSAGAGTLDPVQAGGPLRGYTHNEADGMTASTGSSSWTTYFKPPGQKVNLANAGDKLTVTWKFKLTNVNTSNGSQSFRFGLANSENRVITGNGSPPMGVYSGYAIWGNMGQTLGAGSSFSLRERTNASPGNFLNTTGDFTQLMNGASSPQIGYAADTEYTMTWIMTRGATDNLLLDVSMAGGSLGDTAGNPANDGIIQATNDDLSPNTFLYDTFAIRPSQEAQSATEFLTSLFKVEFEPGPVAGAVPEPGAMTLAGIAVLLAARRRRAG